MGFIEKENKRKKEEETEVSWFFVIVCFYLGVFLSIMNSKPIADPFVTVTKENL